MQVVMLLLRDFYTWYLAHKGPFEVAATACSFIGITFALFSIHDGRKLTRDLGVNLAGVEIILNMREKMDAMQREFERFFDYLQTHAEEFSQFTEPPPEAGALVPLTRASALRRRATSRGQGS